MQACKVTIGSVFALALLMLTSSCGGSGNMGGGTGGGGGPVGPSLYVSGVALLSLSSSIAEFPTTANGEVSPTSTIKAPSDFFFNGLAVDGAGNVYVGTAPDNSGNWGNRDSGLCAGSERNRYSDTDDIRCCDRVGSSQFEFDQRDRRGWRWKHLCLCGNYLKPSRPGHFYFFIHR